MKQFRWTEKEMGKFIMLVIETYFVLVYYMNQSIILLLIRSYRRFKKRWITNSKLVMPP